MIVTVTSLLQASWPTLALPLPSFGSQAYLRCLVIGRACEQMLKAILYIVLFTKDSALPVQMTIMYSNPVICAILGWAFRAERVGFLGALGIVVTLLGVVSVAQPPVIFGGHEWSHRRMAGGQQGGSIILSTQGPNLVMHAMQG